MRKAGGIIAIIAGLLALIAALVTLMLGGLASTVNSAGGSSVIGMGGVGILVCFLLIIFGAIAMNAKTAIPGVFIVCISILGMVYAGSFVAVIMVLALIGGLISFNGPQTLSGQKLVGAPSSDLKRFGMVCGIAVIFLLVILYLSSTSKNSIEEGQSTYASTVKTNPIESAITDFSIQPDGELAEIFTYGGSRTDLQREITLNKIRGKVIEWQLPVYDVSKDDEGYIIQTGTRTGGDILFGTPLVGTYIHIIARNQEERERIEQMKTGDVVSFKGRIDDTTMRNLNIISAVLMPKKVTRPPSPIADAEPGLPAEAAPPESQAKVDAEPTHPTDLQQYLSQSVINMLNDVTINPIAKNLLGKSYDDFIRAIAVSNTKGIEMEGDYYIGIGCSVQGCEHKAGFSIGRDSHEMFAVIVDGETIKTFGVSSYSSLPELLRQRIEHQANAETTSM